MKQRGKVPVILQMEAVECGAASLAMILAYYKRYIPLEKMRIDCNVTRDGSSAKYIVLAAARHGLDAKGYRLSPQQVKDCGDFPMIIHWNFNHFVVLCGFQREKAVIHDPASGREKVEWETFQKSFTGIALRFSPGKDFEPCGTAGSTGKFLRTEFAGLGMPVLFVVALGVVHAFIQLFPPVFYKVFTDQILLGNASEWMRPLILAMIAACGAGMLVGSMKDIYMARIKAKLRVKNVAVFWWKVLRLPISFFSQRFSGDILSRAENYEKMSDFLFGQLVPAVMDLFLMTCILGILFYFNTAMALVVLLAGILQMGIVVLASVRDSNLAKNAGRDNGKMSGMMMSGISMVETVKASGAEAGIVEKISGYRTKYNNSVLALTRKKIYFGILPGLCQGLCNAFILIMGIYAIFEGRQTVGMLVEFQAFLQIFFQPMLSVAGCIQGMQEIMGNVDRIQDVMAYKEDIAERDLFRTDFGGMEKLSGEVELQHVAFGYSPVTKPLLENFCLHASPGSVIALAGGSGSGKSTLAKLLCGLYHPTGGRILFDGMQQQDIDHYVFTNSVAVVDQNISLFAGTLWDNITMWNPEADEKTVMEACKDACIHNDIMMRRDGYQYQVQEGGADFSGGQRQRIEIARAFAANPSVLILDEATSALDVIMEQRIMEAVKRRKVTCFIIAHRLSTIRDADEIILLAKGQIVERGTHQELMKRQGAYAALVGCD